MNFTQEFELRLVELVFSLLLWDLRIRGWGIGGSVWACAREARAELGTEGDIGKSAAWTDGRFDVEGSVGSD